MESPDKVKLIVSDCHLSAGRFFEGRFNPHEDFHFDEEMADLFEYFSTGKYGEGSGGPVECELVINGDFFDFLNVPFEGEFEDLVNEEMAVYKIQAILKGHDQVVKAIRKFASRPGKTVTYLIGNHDADLLFPKVREVIGRAFDPKGEYPSAKVKIIHDKDRIVYPEGIEIRHGNQFEASNALDFEQPFLVAPGMGKILNLPWGSVYILKIVNRLKWEREYLDKIRPVKVLILFGLILDPIFTIRFCFYNFFYYLRARFFSSLNSRKRSGFFGRLREVLSLLKEEMGTAFQDMEAPARQILDDQPETMTVIFGHTHWPMHKVYPDGKQYINTGTWTKMVHLDWRGLQQEVKRTFALIEIRDGQVQCELRQWVGQHSPHKYFHV